MLLAALAGTLAVPRFFEVYGLIAAALGLNALLFAGLARWLFDSGSGEPLGRLLLLGLVAAGLPLLSVVRLLLGDLIAKGVGPRVVGALLLAAAVVVLRSQPLPVFVEQLALPALLVGGGALGFGLFRDLGDRAAATVLCAITLAVAAALPRAWLRVLLGALTWWALRPHRAATSIDQPPSSASPRGKLGIALTPIAVLLVAKLGIWHKQRLIAQGLPAFVELVPVHPRSLMQGDFMQVRFRLPDNMGEPRPGLLSQQRPHVLAQRDARGVVTLQRADPEAPAQPGALRIELTPKGDT